VQEERQHSIILRGVRFRPLHFIPYLRKEKKQERQENNPFWLAFLSYRGVANWRPAGYIQLETTCNEARKTVC
jgi:hypothetical protein